MRKVNTKYGVQCGPTCPNGDHRFCIDLEDGHEFWQGSDRVVTWTIGQPPVYSDVPQSAIDAANQMNQDAVVAEAERIANL